MKGIHVILAFLFIMMCSGCSVTRSDFSIKKIMNVHQGMEQQEIVTILGKPSYRSFDDTMEKWEFREWEVDGWSVAMVYFVDGKVDKLDSFFEQRNKIGVNNLIETKTSEPIDKSSGPEKSKFGGIVVTP